MDDQRIRATPDQLDQVCRELLESCTITQEQFERGQVFSVTDDWMAPHLQLGSFVQAVLLDPAEYNQAINRVVVAVRKGKPHELYIGRLQSIYDGMVTLTFEADVPDRGFNLSGVGQLFVVTHALHMADLDTEQEYQTSRIFPITDDGMAPHLLTGGVVHAVAPERADYAQAVGKICVITNGANWYYIGRLKRFDEQAIEAVQDDENQPALLLQPLPSHTLYVIIATYRPVS